AGGHTAVDIDGFTHRSLPSTILLASCRAPCPSDSDRRPPLADLIPPARVRALATAELFDPRSGTWSPTGSMRFARSGAVAATLTDGRVLVVGSAYDGIGEPRWPDERALDNAEIFQPSTGRFSPAGKLPSLDWVPDFHRRWPVWTSVAGTLVPLPGGDAALLGRISSQYNTFGITRSFRFRAADLSWSPIGTDWLQLSGEIEWPPRQVRDGPDIGGAAVVGGLPDGRVLVAGGGAAQAQNDSPVLAAARFYDPATDAWSKGPKMPKSRTMAAAVPLDDGSVLVVGGYGERYWSDSLPLRSAIRFEPER
ncbi:MAG TPA: kelch repeat-containing protein, partial [Candidatus Limnocylindrales bacterium]|nr:kelch repeat-containing protein [Candidatus Limnocylindrales bacterium]